MLPRKYIEIDNLRMAYYETGEGAPVLLVHGFAASSLTWNETLRHLPKDRRYIMPDLKGFGYSDKTLDDRFSPYHQAKTLSKIVEKLDLEDLTLVGHSYGGAVSLLMLARSEIGERVSKLILIDSAGFNAVLPSFIRQLRIPLANNLLLKHVNSEIISQVILEELRYDKNSIDNAEVLEYSELLRLPGAKDCMIKAAEAISTGKPNKMREWLNRLDIPTLVIWGRKDNIIPLEFAYEFKKCVKDSKLAILPECGHCPQEEKAEDTGTLIGEFLTKGTISHSESLVFETSMKLRSVKRSDAAAAPQDGDSSLGGLKPGLHELVDTWTPGTFIIYVFMKMLQILKRLGAEAKESGWRKTMSTYLRTEHSKFALAVFGLDYTSDKGRISEMDLSEARQHVVERLADFIKNNSTAHWKLKWGKFTVFRERQIHTDMIEVDFDAAGNLLSLLPRFDSDKPGFQKLDDDIIESLRGKIIDCYNRVKDVRDERRPLILKNDLEKWIDGSALAVIVKREMESYVERVLTGNFISFSVMDGDGLDGSGARFALPDFIHSKHAGLGLLNIHCRFNKIFDEADLWFQFQHVPVDGVPMQEFLIRLKRAWGIRRELIYPPLNSDSIPEPQRCSTLDNHKALYQTILFIDFRPLMKTRKKINELYSDLMGGPATVVSIVMWCLTRHHSLRGRKFIFPVELAECEETGQERAPSAIFIRPSKYEHKKKSHLQAFLDFEYDFNLKMNSTRARKSASYEMIELYALTFPLIYTFTRKIMPGALGNYVGTVGITMIRDADLFITPLSDLQSDGFFAVGNLMIPTVDGQKAGCVSIRATREKIGCYAEAVENVPREIDTLLGSMSKPE
ncbi:MAG: alpha/beta hydrolase [Kiritimatiellaeota bacterium]|nr:alpha/beta hydrolase [Kiritimatiellota bacterium]